MFDVKQVSLTCDDCAETVEFCKYVFIDNDINYEINIVDSYCGHGFMGIKGRIRRAWRAFWAKPICYTGVYVEDPERMKKFLTDCLEVMNEE